MEVYPKMVSKNFTRQSLRLIPQVPTTIWEHRRTPGLKKFTGCKPGTAALTFQSV